MNNKVNKAFTINEDLKNQKIDNKTFIIIKKENLKKYEREIDFENKEIQKKYKKLKNKDKEVILDIIKVLYKKDDNLGYNLKCIEELYKGLDELLDKSDKELHKEDCKSKRLKMNQYAISKHIEEYIEKYKKGTNIDKKLHKIVKEGISQKGSDKQDILNVFCEYYLIEPQLLEKGHGTIYTISKEALELIEKNKELIKDIIKKNKNNYPTLKYLIERLGEKIGENLLEEKYAVMLKDGRYIGLKEEDKKIINQLIELLFEYNVNKSKGYIPLKIKKDVSSYLYFLPV